MCCKNQSFMSKTMIFVNVVYCTYEYEDALLVLSEVIQITSYLFFMVSNY